MCRSRYSPRRTYAFCFDVIASIAITSNNVRIPLSRCNRPTTTTSRSWALSLWEGMSSGETLVGEGDGNGGIMGEFSSILKYPPLSSVCKVDPSLPLTFWIVDLCLAAGFSMWAKPSSWKRSEKPLGNTHSVFNVSLAPGICSHRDMSRQTSCKNPKNGSLMSRYFFVRRSYTPRK